ncbi:Rieske 2Fe-2S domain-containing protein, partial [Candidatus Peregrinibacteria bacterium]|nr:Rieske 2Fe-2S domain-containing protein [Candidatus Peregrinibacteria bacterium]
MAEKFIVAKVGDLQNGQKKRVRAGEVFLMLAMVEDKYFAVEDTCSHAQASLSAGYLHGFRIECPRHGAQFDLRTGQVKVLP